MVEGFRKNLGDHEFSYAIYSYNVSTSLLARCKEGENTIEWATAVVPADFKKEEAGFFWLATIDLTTGKHSFDLFFNGKKRFTIPTSQKERWQVTGRDGGTLSYLHHFMEYDIMTGLVIREKGRPPQDARTTTLIEEDLHPLPVTGKEVTVELGPRAIETLKMR